MEKEKFYQLSTKDVLKKLQTDEQTGLEIEEAKKRLDQQGLNEIQRTEHTTMLQKFIDQFKDFMIIVLLIAAFVSWGVSGDASDAIVILIVVIINAVMGVFQENKAEEAIDALQEMSSPEAQVRRGNQRVEIDSLDLVPGDIVYLEAGNIVPADMRLLEENSLQAEESALTGESVPTEKNLKIINKDVGIGDRSNMVYSGTNITYGRGVGVVTATGMDTEVGHIATMLKSTETKKTPLQEDQDELGKTLTYLIIGIALLTFFIGTFVQNIAWTQMLLIAVSLAVAAIPEGLPAITTIILSLGTQNMAKRNALVRSLPAVETLGSTQIIGSDKTGTLTINKMTIENIYYDNNISQKNDPMNKNNSLLRSIMLANDSHFNDDKEIVGDPTETAMIQFGLEQGLDLEEINHQYPRIQEIPFDSNRKLMTTIHEMDNGQFLIAIKGAPDRLLNCVNRIEENGQVREFTKNDKENIESANEKLARRALRVLGAGYKIVDELPDKIISETIENDFIFSGLVGMIDPEREEAKESIQIARRAGVRTIMITGDHALTAQAIAERLTILNKEDENNEEHVRTGSDLDKMTDEELTEKIEDYSVYARVSPEHKVRIIRAWQNKNKVISMTGDGVNDAPALKQADIGVGMGITGTEVSKGASDIVLADDNFATIVHAIEEGRKIFSNIQKSVQYLLSANLGEVLVLFIATLLGWQILEPIHILWINLVTDVFPAIALGMEKNEPDSMDIAPRSKESSFLSNGVFLSIMYQGILEGGITLFVYWYSRYQYAPTMGYGVDEAVAINLAETMAFATLGLIQLFHTYNVKHVFHSVFSTNPFENKYLNGATIFSAALLLGVILIPGLNTYFDITLPDINGWLIVLLASGSIILIVEIVKWFLRKTGISDKYQRKATNI